MVPPPCAAACAPFGAPWPLAAGAAPAPLACTFSAAGGAPAPFSACLPWESWRRRMVAAARPPRAASESLASSAGSAVSTAYIPISASSPAVDDEGRRAGAVQRPLALGLLAASLHGEGAGET